MLEEVNTKLLKKIEDFEKTQCLMQGFNPLEMNIQLENEKLKVDYEKLTLRLRILTKYETSEIEELLTENKFKTDLEYTCLCGGKNFKDIYDTIDYIY